VSEGRKKKDKILIVNRRISIMQKSTADEARKWAAMEKDVENIRRFNEWLLPEIASRNDAFK